MLSFPYYCPIFSNPLSLTLISMSLSLSYWQLLCGHPPSRCHHPSLPAPPALLRSKPPSPPWMLAGPLTPTLSRSPGTKQFDNVLSQQFDNGEVRVLGMKLVESGVESARQQPQLCGFHSQIILQPLLLCVQQPRTTILKEVTSKPSQKR